MRDPPYLANKSYPFDGILILLVEIWKCYGGYLSSQIVSLIIPILGFQRIESHLIGIIDEELSSVIEVPPRGIFEGRISFPSDW